MRTGSLIAAPPQSQPQEDPILSLPERPLRLAPPGPRPFPGIDLAGPLSSHISIHPGRLWCPPLSLWITGRLSARSLPPAARQVRGRLGGLAPAGAVAASLLGGAGGQPLFPYDAADGPLADVAPWLALRVDLHENAPAAVGP